MESLLTVKVARVYRAMKGGVTAPLLTECSFSDESKVDVIVKYGSHQRCPPGNLARELIGTLLARHLGVSVPAPLLVDIPQTLASSPFIHREYPDFANWASSNSKCFGSTKLPDGYQMVSAGQSGVNGELKSKIWATDHILVNPDRTYSKPNCLSLGSHIIAIDYEKSLNVIGCGFLFQPPWSADWSAQSSHLFASHDLNKSAVLEVTERLGNTSDAELDGLIDCVPEEWARAEVCGDISSYLKTAVRRADEIRLNLERSIP